MDELLSTEFVPECIVEAPSNGQPPGASALPTSTAAPPRSKTLSPDPVELGSSTLTSTMVDLQNRSPFPIVWARTYSMATKSWVFSYDMAAAASQVDSLDALLTLRRNDNQILTFTGTRATTSSPWVWAAQNGTTPEDPIVLSVTSSSDLTAVTVVDVNSTIESYSNGRLVELTDVHGNTQTLAYDGSNRLASVTDSAGRSITLTYSPSQATTVQIANGQTDSNGNPITQGSTSYSSSAAAAVDYTSTPATVSDGVHTVAYAYTYASPTSGVELMELTSVTHPDGTHFSYQYDATGRWTTTIDENGAVYQTYTYNSAGVSSTMLGSNISGSTNPGGGVDLYSTNPSLTVLPSGANVGTSYNGDGQLASSDFPCPDCQNLDHKAISYDSSGDPIRLTDFAGNIETRTYDTTRGLMLSQTQGAGSQLARTRTTTWDSRFRAVDQYTTPVQTPSGVGSLAVSFTYDANANLLGYGATATGPAGSGYTLTVAGGATYNTAGQTLTATDPNGNVTRFAYDGSGNMTSVTDALGHVTTYGNYDAVGNVGLVTDPNGVTTAFAYDANQNITSITRGCSGCTAQTYTISYAPTGLVQKITAPNGTGLQYAYDSAHRVTSAALLDSNGNTLGSQIVTENPANEITALTETNTAGATLMQRNFTYDTLGRVKAFVDQSGNTFAMPLDNQGRLTAQTDPQGRGVTAFTYDALNRQIQATWSDSTTTKTAYGPNDEVVSQTDALGHTTSTTYDGLGRVVGVTSPDSGQTTLTRDANGNVLTSTDARGTTITTTYDALDRPLTQIGSASGSTETYTYDTCANGIGRLCSITDPSGTTSFTYDAFERVASKTTTVASTGLSLTVSYGYDAFGEPTAITYPSGLVVTQTWANGFVTGITTAGGSSGGAAIASSIQHDPFGRLMGWTWGTTPAVPFAMTYDANGRPTGAANGAVGSVPAAGEGWGYDKSWNIASTVYTDTSTTVTDTYDAHNRLVSDSTWGSFTWDANSNRLTATGALGPRAATYTTGTDRLASDGANTVAVDAAGDITGDNGWTYTYDDWGRLVGATTGTGSGSANMTLAVNALGERVGESETAGGATTSTAFLYGPDGTVLGQYNAASGQAVEELAYLDGKPLASIRTSGVYFVETDARGAPVRVRDGSGAIAWSWENPEPFGTTAPTQGTEDGSPFVFNLRFPGQWFDSTTGLLFNGFRDYNPALGRYMEVDPMGLAAGMNPYVYVGGNPMTGVDPTGLSQRDTARIVADAQNIVDQMTANNERFPDPDWNNRMRLRPGSTIDKVWYSMGPTLYHAETGKYIHPPKSGYLDCAGQSQKMETTIALDMIRMHLDDEWRVLANSGLGHNWTIIAPENRTQGDQDQPIWIDTRSDEISIGEPCQTCRGDLSSYADKAATSLGLISPHGFVSGTNYTPQMLQQIKYPSH